ncbi:hypothetical protein HDV01_007313 [Terramyces sp. JEL0728]|nr:hypothetical protein HDV01_007313 [Terramyces sp. JEL0728]
MVEESDREEKLKLEQLELDKLPYKWKQTLQEVDLTIQLPKGTRGRDLQVTITKTHLSVTIKGQEPIVKGELCAPIKEEESTWLIDNNELLIHLEKINKQEWWKNVVTHHFAIDTTLIQPENSKLSELDGETRGMVEKMMEWVDSARDSIASPINDLGTVQINETELQTANIPKLRDLFEPAQPAFMQVFEPEKGLFKNKYDTLTRNQLSEIMETINYPEKDQTIDLERYKANREEYPENIDFLDQPSDEEPSLENAHEEQQVDLFTDKPIKHHSELDHPIIEKEDHSHLIDSVKEIKTTDRYSSPNDDTPMNYRQPKKIHRSQSDVAMQFKHLEDSLHNVSNYIARGVEIDCTDLNKTEKSFKNDCSLTAQRQINPFGTSNDYIDLGNLNLDSLQGLINAKTNYRKVIASNNQLKFVDEIPGSTGSLFIGRNQLSNLTSFSHLKCLKVLDISFNCLTDLSGTFTLI